MHVRGAPPGPPGKSSLKLHGGRRPPKNFFTRVPPVLIFLQVSRRRREKKFYKGPPCVIFLSFKNLKVSTQVTRNFGLDRGGLVTKFLRFTNMYGNGGGFSAKVFGLGNINV